MIKDIAMTLLIVISLLSAGILIFFGSFMVSIVIGPLSVIFLIYALVRANRETDDDMT